VVSCFVSDWALSISHSGAKNENTINHEIWDIKFWLTIHMTPIMGVISNNILGIKYRSLVTFLPGRST
jgi:hypothetical protein